MPTYKFKSSDKDSEDIWEETLKISELDDYVNNNNCKIVIVPISVIGGGVKDLYSRSDGDFKSRMKNLKKFYPNSKSLKDW